VDCVAEGRRTVRRPVTISGADPNRRPFMVWTLVVANVAVFVVTVIQARSITNLTPSALYDDWVLTPVVARSGYWWQLVTAGFVHVSPIHILFNMVALFVIGRDLERVLGPLRFSAVYLLGVLGGNIAVFVFGAVTYSVAGASTGVFALMGGLLVVVYRLKLNPSQVITMIVINLVISVVIPGISLLGHVGGLIAGAVVTAGLIWAPAERRTMWQTTTVVAVFVVLIGLALVRAPYIPALT
jgi:membrane associated rhomboid family serine protease